MSKYLRHQPIISRSCDDQVDGDHWMTQFAKNLEKEAVKSKQEDNSLFHQITNIMNGSKAKHSSVQDAVDEMKARSGLTAYLNSLNKTSDQEIEDTKIAKKTASNEFFERGEKDGKEDLDEHGFGSSIIASIKSQRNKIPYSQWMAYARGYASGSNMSDRVKEKEFNNVEAYVEKHSKKDDNSALDKTVDFTPTVIKKFPNVKTTLQNHIRDSRGNLSIPAIIDKVRSIHQNDVSDAKDWEDDKLMLYVSKLNLQAKKDNPSLYNMENNLGSKENMSSDDDVDPSNSDAFYALNPYK